jgi:hypothetical protein
MTMASGDMHFRENAFVKHSSGTLGVGVFYHGYLAFSPKFRQQLEISEEFVRERVSLTLEKN